VQYGLPSVAPSKKHKKSHKHKEHKKMFKRFKKRSFEPNEFYKKKKRKSPNNEELRINQVFISVISQDTLENITKLRILLNN
jgi:hypothetical protein